MFDISAAALKPFINKTLDLSAYHVPKATFRKLREQQPLPVLYHLVGANGVVLGTHIVGTAADPMSPIDKPLEDLLILAQNHGCQNLRLDIHGEVHPDIPTYNW